MSNEFYSREYLIDEGVDSRLVDVLLSHSDITKGSSLLEFFNKNRDRMGTSIINIGLSGDECSLSWVNFFLDVLKFKKITIVEFHKPNYVQVCDRFEGDKRVKVFHGDVRKIDTFIESNSDACFWWHGPEHIPLADLPLAYAKLKEKTNKAMLWACPWGNYYNCGEGMYLGDGHHFYPENNHFLDLGMDVMNTGGPKDTGNANIFAYKFFENKDE